MEWTRKRHAFLRRIAAGEPDVGMTSSPILDRLVRERLVAPGLSDTLTAEGVAHLDRWNHEHPLTAQKE